MDCCCCLYYILPVLGLLCLYLYVVVDKAPSFSVATKHIIVTGGSSGIGLATTIGLLRRQAKVTIIARNKDKLDEALASIKSQIGSTDNVLAISADVSDPKSIKAAAKQSVDHFGDIGAVIASAGVAKPLLFHDLIEEDFEYLMRVNYLGVAYTLKAIVPFMQAHKKGGRIILVSSMAGQSGVAGMTGYGASKFAVRGLAEALHMELRRENIYVSVCNPPDVDTPMLAEENKIKPKECKQISEGSGLFTADQIANDIINSLQNWKFFIQTGFDGRLLGLISTGTSPASSIFTSLIELFFLGTLRAISLGYTWNFNRICEKVHQERTKSRNKKQN